MTSTTETLELLNKAKKIIEGYKKLKIGPYFIVCPYFQNIPGYRRRAAFVGKGMPEEIERETTLLFKKAGKDVARKESDSIRLVMIGAGLGIDCSGFVANVLEEVFRERGKGPLARNLRPIKGGIAGRLRHIFRAKTNISADMLTSLVNCNKVSLSEVLPGDLMRVGRGHVAIVTSVVRKKGKVSRIIYHHSTSDYLDKNGVRQGRITVKNQNLPLEKQDWREVYRGRNWMHEDYI